MKFSIKDFFSKCDQILDFLLIWSHLLKKSLMENFIFVQWKTWMPNQQKNYAWEKINTELKKSIDDKL